MRRLIVALGFVPFIALAQSDGLREQIRADLASDPRTAEMSEEELNALVDALVQEAADSGVADTYLDAKSAPTFMYDPAPVEETNPYVLILTAPIMIAFLALLAGICGLVFLFMRSRHRHSVPDLQNS